MTVVRGCLILGLAAGLAATTAAAVAQERRELGAHEHGHSALNIAVEGKRVSMELRAPGKDIVGFEHEAATDADKAAMKRAEAALGDPLSLFVLPSAAGCKLAAAEVGLAEEDHHAEGHDQHAKDEEAEEGEHAEFHAEYALDCADPTRLDAITFAFFERFPGAEEVEVTLVTPSGQSTFEVERGQPRLKLDRVS